MALRMHGALSGIGTASSQRAGVLRHLPSAIPARGASSFAATSSSYSNSLLRQSLKPCSATGALLPMGSSCASAWRGVCFAAAAEAPPAAPPAPASAVKEAHGFELQRQQWIKEYDSHMLIYKHKKTGAEVISVVNDDENKTFGVVFRTPVDNSYGIPHILEHSVLCGSRKYPIKEPFVELMKGSLNTFLNAFTYPDRTCYPVASTNKQDFYNLVDVYLDAVFHPRCINDPKVFEQEGWHYELDSPQDELSFKGVVFNEMKGVYSSPDSVFYRAVQQALFPHNTYSHDSGGDPTQIPALTFDHFQDFHSKYYHPSNARFWFHGDDDPVERLRILAEYLDEFERKEVSSSVATQPLLPEPRRVTEYYAAGEEAAESGAGEKGQAYVAVNWVMEDKEIDVETELALGFLDYLMLGTNASPLRKALNDSGLGSALLGGGMDDELKQPIFSLGLKGMDAANTEKLENLILSKLEELEKSGFSSSAVEAAINTIEFSLRENNTGSFPRGLSLMLRAMNAWIYDRDPLVPLQWEDALASFKARLASGEDVFGPLIRKYLLDNKHRVTVVLLPDPTLGAKVEGEEKAKLEAKMKSMQPKDVEEVVANTHELKRRQETPDAPEALSCVPALKLSDIPKTVTKVPTEVSSRQGATILTHDLFTNNVVYMEAVMDMKSVPLSLLPLVPLFCRSLTNMATEKESFVELVETIGRKTGGLSVFPFTSPIRNKPDEPLAKIMVRGKAMADKSGDLVGLVRDVLLGARLDDQARFKQMVEETKAGLETMVISGGHSFAMKRLNAQMGLAGWMSEQMGGLSYLEFMRNLSKRVDSEWDSVKADLHTIRAALLSRTDTLVNLTGDAASLDKVSPAVDDFLSSLPEKPVAGAPWGASASGLLFPKKNEALTVPTQVNYVGKVANLYQDGGYDLSGSSYVVEKYLGNTWLWDKVRVVGGAYGGFCSFDPHSGNFAYLSYRDPNLLETLEAYDGSPNYLKTLELTQEELTKAIIGTIGDVDAYQLPDAKGYSAMGRYLLGISDEERQLRRDQILSTSPKDFKEFGEVLECVNKAGRVAAVTSAEKAKAVNEQIPSFWELKKVL
uniref:Peptidase M16C associated domain-containing protein n=1 Tax=Dunaliella tertiolecta TaxID=3047 RepID=A0A7S3VL18_DUNTE|mmetsp:Transcript_4503/g.12288  ORF Transcript_4503/g.12288 Transcript_4503/m.12288 type:complete len:1084 (-) Transcript_4503:601-3852(-)|eukprot:CAMPEP_0202352554 /NCGR_PEP_ID=MMETSP1126-20121109/8699_1 /ASSEMBLY_ACC=CAM_ASM_000457 /TAXON_ID=3047 /ORGANISM="Dunaliella tertiolecta, Strain CCMP1320" /LENGTH=1083 /DNA_ID=CAMNT_0048944787 /DNA_START=52 /DNA_END=3303 /DNA_ORIENTATION=+